MINVIIFIFVYEGKRIFKFVCDSKTKKGVAFNKIIYYYVEFEKETIFRYKSYIYAIYVKYEFVRCC